MSFAKKIIFPTDNDLFVDNKFNYCSIAVVREHVGWVIKWRVAIDTKTSKNLNSRPDFQGPSCPAVEVCYEFKPMLDHEAWSRYYL